MDILRSPLEAALPGCTGASFLLKSVMFCAPSTNLENAALLATIPSHSDSGTFSNTMALSIEAQQQLKSDCPQRRPSLQPLRADCQALSSSPAYPLQEGRLCGPEAQISRSPTPICQKGRASKAPKTQRASSKLATCAVDDDLA
jgi:hypothetical protein